MTLLTKDLLRRLPPLYATEDVGAPDKVAQAKFFTPWTGWTWFVLEYDPDERLLFTLVVGLETEFGYASLDELEAIRGPGGLRIERDLHFKATRLKDIPGLTLP